jgi:hypothetical protein
MMSADLNSFLPAAGLSGSAEMRKNPTLPFENWNQKPKNVLVELHLRLPWIGSKSKKYLCSFTIPRTCPKTHVWKGEKKNLSRTYSTINWFALQMFHNNLASVHIENIVKQIIDLFGLDKFLAFALDYGALLQPP